jgi:hypothetical protein
MANAMATVTQSNLVINAQKSNHQTCSQENSQFLA